MNIPVISKFNKKERAEALSFTPPSAEEYYR